MSKKSENKKKVFAGIPLYLAPNLEYRDA